MGFWGLRSIAIKKIFAKTFEYGAILGAIFQIKL
jgi:hypothetical protein